MLRQSFVLMAAFAACSPPARRQPVPPEPAAAAVRPDYEAHVAKLRKRLPNADFHIVVQPPFVVVGDESEALVRRRAEKTVRWAVDLLKKKYFAKDPDHIIDVWLFRGRGSYQKHCRLLFGEKPGTPFGYYSPKHKALIMNIATGGGTLVHEIVHPFVAANFSACPAWLNEGLGSLYEQCGERDGEIVGYTNWRLRGLQQAIRADRVPAFATLMGTSDDEFYGSDPGTNYSQARYLCYYLQEKKLLRRFYRSFHAARRQDPSGYATLQKVLGRTDMDAFQKEWQRYVLTLRFGD